MPFEPLNSPTPRDHLIVPDYHVTRDFLPRRFKALGNYIVEHLPEVIVFMGDQADMPSLSSYDVGKKEFVFQNVQDDIEAMHLAEAFIFEPVHQFNSNQKKSKKKTYEPTVIKLFGNHEQRLKKLLEYEPRWQSEHLNMEVFMTRQPINEQTVNYMDWIEVDGVFYSHLWASGVLGKACPNAKAILAKKGVSATMGHSHTLDTASLTKPDGSRMRGLICGSFLDPDNESFAGPQVDQIYHSGIILKHAVFNGDYDLEEIRVECLLENYL